MSALRRFMCGVPERDCSGGLTILSTPWLGSNRTHSTRNEAFKCFKRHLLRQGYEQIAPREFRKPGEPVLVLTKAIRFGGELRKGKSGKGEKGRFMGKKRNSGGLIAF